MSMLRCRTHYCCEPECGMLIIYSPERGGFISGCEHEPPSVQPARLSTRERNLVAAAERERHLEDKCEEY